MIHRLYTDAETFSSIEISRGLANYWDPFADTGVHCIAYKLDDGPIKIWRAQTAEGPDPFPAELYNLMNQGSLIVAHKAEFEHYMFGRFFDYTYPLTQMRCTMAKAAAMALPLPLGKLSLALGFPEGKNTEGQKAMKILCKPNPKTGRHWLYHEAPDLFEALYRYCIHDVQLEYAIDHILPDLTDEEQAMWVLDQQINRRGIGVDRRAAAAAYEICSAEIQRLDKEIKEASGGAVDSTKAVLQIAKFCNMDSVAKANIEEALEQPLVVYGGMTEVQRKVLQIRQEAAKSSVLKLKPMLELCGSNGRLEWTQQFNGAGTGRWGGRNPQPHNFPRGSLHIPPEEQERTLDALSRGATEAEDFIRGPRLSVISDLLRGMFVAADGYEFSSYDFAQIEMVLGAWFVGDQGLLDVFNGDRKVYEYTYATSFGVPQSSVTPDQRQIGKHLALGAQFGGGAGALVHSAWNLGKLKFDTDPEKADAIAEDLKVRWRAAHSNYPLFWKELEQAAKSAVLNPGIDFVPRMGVTKVSYKVPMADDGTPSAVLCCTLPSGRVISYPYPRIERKTVVKKNGETWDADSLSYMVSDSGRWTKTYSYGGKLFENIVQAAAADLLRFGITNLNNAGVPTILMVHDEVVTETLRGSMTWERGREIMERRPHWCPDLPIKVTGWQGRRYRKE